MDELLAEIELEVSPIPDGVYRHLDEVTIKRDGCIWRIHKNDADPFPSNPHAHNVESGLKLDLSTGALYFGRKPSGKSIPQKAPRFHSHTSGGEGRHAPTSYRLKMPSDHPYRMDAVLSSQQNSGPAQERHP